MNIFDIKLHVFYIDFDLKDDADKDQQKLKIEQKIQQLADHYDYGYVVVNNLGRIYFFNMKHARRVVSELKVFYQNRLQAYPKRILLDQSNNGNNF